MLLTRSGLYHLKLICLLRSRLLCYRIEAFEKFHYTSMDFSSKPHLHHELQTGVEAPDARLRAVRLLQICQGLSLPHHTRTVWTFGEFFPYLLLC